MKRPSRSFKGLTDCKPFLKKSEDDFSMSPSVYFADFICSDCFALVLARQLPWVKFKGAGKHFGSFSSSYQSSDFFTPRCSPLAIPLFLTTPT